MTPPAGDPPIGPGLEAACLTAREQRAFKGIVAGEAHRSEVLWLSRYMSYVSRPPSSHVRKELERDARGMWRRFP